MKKLSVFLLAIMLVVLTACGDSNNTDTPNTPNEPNINTSSIMPPLWADVTTLMSTTVLASEISVHINGVPVVFDQPPINYEGRTLVPLRAIFEALGATVEWDTDTETVTSERDGVTILLTIGSNILLRNGEQITLDVPAQIVDGRTMIPARAIAESFGLDVTWDGINQTVLIDTIGDIAVTPPIITPEPITPLNHPRNDNTWNDMSIYTTAGDNFICYYSAQYYMTIVELFDEQFFEENYLVTFILETSDTGLGSYVADILENGDIIMERVIYGEDEEFGQAITEWSYVIALNKDFTPDEFSVIFFWGKSDLPVLIFTSAV